MKLLLAALALAPANVDVRASDVPQRWAPANVRIEVGDSVTWRFDGTSLAHNVASTSANWSFVSPFDGQPATYTFTAPGTYRFVCQAHAFTMNGLVRVGAAEPDPEPGGGALPNGSGAPRVDVRPPEFRRVRVRRQSGGAHVRYRLSERAHTVVRVKRSGRLVWRRAVRGRRGALRVSGLRPRRYEVALRARDFGGNPSRIVRRPLRVYR